MPREQAQHSSGVALAFAIATTMMAWQVAGKATRDGLFLSSFSHSALPAMMAGAAISSIVMALLNTALLRRFGPGKVIPAGYLLGMSLHALEWFLLPGFPRGVAIAVYIQVVAVGSVLLSGFWALANERFNPREARRHFGRIAAFGTFGTLIGGVLAERVASLFSTQGLLVLLGVLQLACSILLFRFAPRSKAPSSRAEPSFPEVISGARYLLGLACLVIVAAMAASSLDYLFKTQAAANFAKGAPLSRFFALFYMVTSALTFGVQAMGSSMWLKRFGPGRTVAVLPVAVTGVSVASLFAPGLITLTISRAVELLLRGSLYRSGYELFYTPMPSAEKRSTKSVIDIGAERLGDGLAGASIQLLLALPAEMVTVAILALTAALSGLGVWLAMRLDKVYVKILERGLEHHAAAAPAQAEVPDDASLTIALNSMATPGVVSGAPAFPHSIAPPAAPVLKDPALRHLVELRSGDTARITAALARMQTLAPIEVPQVIELLDRDDVAQAAYFALKKNADAIAGQLVDAMQNPASTFNVRKRIPKVLSSCKNRTACNGLIAHLTDERFEVRTRCAKALEKMMTRAPELRPDPPVIFEVVSKELVTARKFSQQSSRQSGITMEGVLKERASKTIEHIFTLLGLVLPRQSVRLAFRALQPGGSEVRGVALEYLDSILPKSLREALTSHFEGSAPVLKGPAMTPEAVAQLVDSNPSMMHRIEYWESARGQSGEKKKNGDSAATQSGG